jgi:hypothetical protein
MVRAAMDSTGMNLGSSLVPARPEATRGGSANPRPPADPTRKVQVIGGEMSR